jgi:hypothetical protein
VDLRRPRVRLAVPDPSRSAQRRVRPARVCLSLVMASYFADACEDLPAVPAGELYLRFLGWVRGAR